MELGLVTLWIVLILLWILYKLAYLNESFFRDRGVAFAKPLPFFGNTMKLMFKKRCTQSILNDLYKKFKNERFFGFFNLRKPFYVVRDPELIKQITIKDFEYFMNHIDFVDRHVDPLLGRILINMKGSEWKNMRSLLSPMFTSSKMKMMFNVLVENANDFNEYFVEQNNKTGRVIVEGKDVFSKFTMNGISHTVLGMQTNCLRNENEPVYYIGRNLVDRNILIVGKLLLASFLPFLYKLFGVKILSKRSQNFAKEISIEAIKYREKHNIVRTDVLQLLMEAKKGALKYEETEEETANFSAHKEYVTDSSAVKNYKWTDEDIMAQCLIFFFAGFETTSNLLQMTAYELAKSPEIQSELIREVDEVKEDLQGASITYEALNKMKFLDMVICEILRKWPPGPQAGNRITTKSYVFKNTNGQSVKLEPGDNLIFPVIALHYDEKYWPNPKKFDPYRFDDNNKKNIHPGTYLPFGIGPRICIGSRFALMEAKVLIYTFLTKFTFEVCERTPSKIMFKGLNGPDLKTPAYVEFRPRKFK